MKQQPFSPAVVNPVCRSQQRPWLSLNGAWQFELDPRDEGKRRQWQNRKSLPDEIRVPGSLQAQGFGGYHPHSISQMGHPTLQVERTAYLGTAWYRKSFTVPADWRGKRIWLKFGGVHQRAEFWVNGHYLGADPGGLLAFKWDITPLLQRDAENAVVVRVFEGNRVNWDVAINGGVYCWATRWSGLYRGVELEATTEPWIERLMMLPSWRRRQVEVLVQLAGHAGKDFRLRIAVQPERGGTENVWEQPLNLRRGSQAVTAVIPLDDPRTWSPDTPDLYRLTAALIQDGIAVDGLADRFGLRDFNVKGDKILINDQPVFLRGFGFNAVFPRTLSPDLDPAWIRKQCRTAREYGFNAIASYVVPYQELLDIADEEGLLLQVFPGDLSGTALTRRAHLQNLMFQNINHASIMVYGWSAERYDNTPELVNNLDRLYAFSKAFDPTRLVIARDGGGVQNTRQGKTDFMELACCYRTCYTEHVLRTKVKMPCLLHEVGWFSSYPNPALKHKYRGTAMNPFFIDYAEKVARRQGVAHLVPTFVRNSERLQALERRTAIERIRRNPAMSGFHLWMGNDTVSAVEGIWDDFSDPKNVSAAEALKFNGDTVLLMEQDFRGRDTLVVPPDDTPETNPHDIDRDMQGRTLWEGERLKLDIRVSHYGVRPISNGVLQWRLKEAGRRTISAGNKAHVTVPSFTVSKLARLDIKMPTHGRAAKLSLEVALSFDGRTVHNDWNFWVFPHDVLTGREPGVYVYGNPGKKDYGMDLDYGALRDGLRYFERYPKLDTDSRLVINRIPADTRLVIGYNHLSNGLIDYLAAGGRVFLMTELIFPEYFHRFRSIGWNASPYGNSGTIVQNHPALKRFPHEGWCDLQFYDLARTVTAQRLEEGGVINLDIWSKPIEPIIRSIDSYMGARRRGLLFEVRVGQGHLLVSRLNFVNTPASRFLFSELVRYLLRGKFRPAVSIPDRFLRGYVRWG